MQIITQGEKIKAIRKKYGIKQQELAGDQITRNMISMLETGKSRLTESTAQLLLLNIQKFCVEREIVCDTLLSDLLDDTQDQMTQIYTSLLTDLETSPTETIKNTSHINEVIILLEKYQLHTQKITIYETLASNYYTLGDYEKAYTYYLISLDSPVTLADTDKTASLLHQLMHCCDKLERYDTGLSLYNRMSPYLTGHSTLEVCNGTYHAAFAYQQLGHTTEALTVLETLLETHQALLDMNLSLHITVLLLQANCLKQDKHYSKALALYDNLFTLCADHGEYTMILYAHILSVYMELNDLSAIKKYLAKSERSLDFYEQSHTMLYSTQIYMTLGSVYEKLGDFFQSEHYYNRALADAKQTKDGALLTILLRKLLHIYIKLNASAKVNQLKNEILEDLSLQLIPYDSTLVLELIQYYSAHQNTENINALVGFILSRNTPHTP